MGHNRNPYNIRKMSTYKKGLITVGFTVSVIFLIYIISKSSSHTSDNKTKDASLYLKYTQNNKRNDSKVSIQKYNNQNATFKNINVTTHGYHYNQQTITPNVTAIKNPHISHSTTTTKISIKNDSDDLIDNENENRSTGNKSNIKYTILASNWSDSAKISKIATELITINQTDNISRLKAQIAFAQNAEAEKTLHILVLHDSLGDMLNTANKNMFLTKDNNVACNFTRGQIIEDNFSAVLFQRVDESEKKLMNMHLKKKKDQVWIYNVLKEKGKPKNIANVFDLVSTNNFNSHIPFVMSIASNMPVNKQEVIYPLKSEVVVLGSCDDEKRNFLNLLQNKSIIVHDYSSCTKKTNKLLSENKNILNEIKKNNVSFVLHFDSIDNFNTIYLFKHIITDSMVPIIKSADEKYYRNIASKHSFLAVDPLSEKSLNELVNKLNNLTSFTIRRGYFEPTRVFCRLCAILHAKPELKEFNINNWLRENVK